MKDLITLERNLIRFIYAHDLNESELNDDEYLTTLINNFYENI